MTTIHNSMQNSYFKLANGIILQAVKDYRKAHRKKRNKQNEMKHHPYNIIVSFSPFSERELYNHKQFINSTCTFSCGLS